MRTFRACAAAALVSLAGLSAACGEAPATGPTIAGPGARPATGSGDKADDATPPPAYANPDRDVVSTALTVDLATNTATARIRLAASEQRGASFEAQGLDVTAVRNDTGELPFQVSGGKLHVDAPRGRWWTELEVDYSFQVQDENDGWLAGGSTVLWPYFCGNVFPCRSTPSDGMAFQLTLKGVPDGQVAIYPDAVDAPAPPYMLAWAIGSYECEDLGETTAGTKVKTCWLPRGKTAALAGTKDLVAAFDWFETTLGPYAYGDEVGAVAVRWGESAAGGMEHHPYWHVDVTSMADPVTQVHEAAHGWFGDGVRIQCWEDFVLSEGTVSYLSARALGAVGGPEVEAAIWRDYEENLRDAIRYEDTVPWPRSCGEVDILDDGLFSNVVYMKGAFFYRALAGEIGVETLDGVLARFYQDRVGTSAGFQDLLDAVKAATGYDAGELADAWLRHEGPAPR